MSSISLLLAADYCSCSEIAVSLITNYSSYTLATGCRSETTHYCICPYLVLQNK